MSLPTADFLFRLADAADAETLPRFRAGIAVDDKRPGDFDPVTEADRASERAIRALLAKHCPNDPVLGEEYGESDGAGGGGMRPEGSPERLWVIDPIDGTRAFITGVPVWGTLIGFCENGRARVGIMSQPFTGERFHADGETASLTRGGRNTLLRASATTSLAETTLFTTSPRLFSGDAAVRYATLETSVRLTRYSLDCYGYCLLAAGQADLVVETGLKPYDIVALVPIIEQAGGIVTTFDGGRPEGGGDIIAAATPQLHAAALAIMNG